MTRLMMTGAAVALAAAVAVPVVAQQPQGRGQGRQGVEIGRRGGPGGPGGGPMALLRGVQLTDAQREQIRAIHQDARPEASAPKVADLQRQLNLALLADAPDLGKIAELKSAITTAHGEMLARRIDVETRIAQVLTPEQRAQARDRLAKAPAGGRGPRGPRR